MQRLVLALFICGIVALGGCGDDHNSPPPLVAPILSDAAYDGDIVRDSVTGELIPVQGNTESVYVGFDPADGDEFRAFIDFPLRVNGGVPDNAIIVSATLDLFINSILPNPLIGTIPIRIDLVSFIPPILIGSDFDRTSQPALASMTIAPPISQADFSEHVVIDVTELMVEAQRLGLTEFQLRILRDPGSPAPGLIEINDTTGPQRGQLAPFLLVEYF